MTYVRVVCAALVILLLCERRVAIACAHVIIVRAAVDQDLGQGTRIYTFTAAWQERAVKR